MRGDGRWLRNLGLFVLACGTFQFLLVASLVSRKYLTWEVCVVLGFGGFLGVLALITGILQNRADKRRQRGLCENCGYNLTGLPEPRCPECGQPFEAKGDAP